MLIDPPEAEPYTLERYLFFSSRFRYNNGNGRQVAAAISSLYFWGGVFTGYPAAPSRPWLQLQCALPQPARIYEALVELSEKRILRRTNTGGRGNRVRVFALETNERDWLWPPGPLYDLVAGQWWDLTHPEVLYLGAPHVLRVLAPLLTMGRGPDLTVDCENPRTAKWMHTGKRIADHFGLSTLEEAVEGVLVDPDALDPWTEAQFERHLTGFVGRGRRAREADYAAQLAALRLDRMERMEYACGS